MRLEDPNTVDFLGLEKATGIVLVTLVDDCNWTDEARHLQLLQAKFNRYLDFIEGGEVYERVLETTGREVPPGGAVAINVLAKYPLEGEGKRFLEHVTSVAAATGIEVRFKVVGPNA